MATDRLQLMLLTLTFLAQLGVAQAPRLPAQSMGAVLSGIVRDSLGRTPLAGAVVQLVTADTRVGTARSAVSDSLGRYVIREVPDGRYLLGFLHPMLDSLGLEPMVREVEILGAIAVRADLGIPSAGRLREAICGPRSVENTGAVIAGFVRESRDGAAAQGVAVVGEWTEFSFKPGGLERRNPQVATTTEANGWFALCNVPSPGAMRLTASRGGDSTDVIDVNVPEEPFLRRDLYLGPSRVLVTGDSVGLADTTVFTARRVRAGDGHLRGSVVTADGRPLAGARVSMPDGPQTRTNDRGQWTLVDVPAGTRTLEVRAISFYPERRAVNVVPGAPSVTIVLSTLAAVLDTVRVTGARLADQGRGFEERRRNSAVGHFLTREDIARRAVNQTSELFRTIPGFSTDVGIAMRSAFGACAPALFLDGRYLPTPFGELNALDIDTWVRPNEIAGIEVYFDHVPPQFQYGMTGCGSIVIWTRR